MPYIGSDCNVVIIFVLFLVYDLVEIVILLHFWWKGVKIFGFVCVGCYVSVDLARMPFTICFLFYLFVFTDCCFIANKILPFLQPLCTQNIACLSCL